jgi:hypothetical protein
MSEVSFISVKSILQQQEINTQSLKEGTKMKNFQENSEAEKLPCDECRKLIPRGTALTVDGWEKVFHFCDVSCLRDWEEKKRDKGSTSGDGT